MSTVKNSRNLSIENEANQTEICDPNQVGGFEWSFSDKISQLSITNSDRKNNAVSNDFHNMDIKDVQPVRKLCGIPLNRTFRMAIYTICHFSSGVAYALPAPFYPQVAIKKGMSLTLTGVVFSIFEFVVFITSPLFGSYMSAIGAKFAFTAGIMVAGACTILFGMLDMCPSGATFLVLSLLVRCFGAVGFSSFMITLFAAASAEYQDKAATAMSILEGAFGIGMMVGPSIGGLLYTSGGFGFPFYFLGGFIVIQGILSHLIITLPNMKPEDKSGSLLTLLRSPVTLIAAISFVVGDLSISCLNPTLSQHLEPFGLSVLLISLFFVITPTIYTVTSPLCGYLSDKRGLCKELIVVGQFIYGIGFIVIGPSDALPFLPKELWVVTVGLVLVGMTRSCSFVPNFKCMLVGAADVGLEENMETYGLVSGLATSCYSLGAFIGPMLGGALVEKLGDSAAYSIIGLLNIAVSFAALAIFAIHRLRDNGYDRLSSTSTQENSTTFGETSNLISK